MSKIDISSRFNNFNKWGLITGACGLLGQKHALALLETGASVVLTDINEKLLIKTWSIPLSTKNLLTDEFLQKDTVFEKLFSLFTTAFFRFKLLDSIFSLSSFMFITTTLLLDVEGSIF